jgi:hypothetical protein
LTQCETEAVDVARSDVAATVDEEAGRAVHRALHATVDVPVDRSLDGVRQVRIEVLEAQANPLRVSPQIVRPEPQLVAEEDVVHLGGTRSWR